MIITAEILMRFDEQQVVQEMLETGEYGVNGYPITSESIGEFIALRSFGAQVSIHKDASEYGDLDVTFNVITDDYHDPLWKFNPSTPRKDG